VVKPVISVEPGRVSMSGFPEENMSQRVVIQTNLDKPLLLSKKELTIPSKITYGMATIKEMQSYEISFTNLSKETGVYRGRLILETNYPQRPVIVVPIFCRILDEIQVTPKTVDFGTISRDRLLETIERKNQTNQRFLEHLPKLEREIIVRNNRKGKFRVEKAEIDGRYFLAELNRFPDGNGCRNKLRALICNMRKELIENRLQIHTDSRSHPLVEIPVRISIQ
jgi:hypothetical protein